MLCAVHSRSVFCNQSQILELGHKWFSLVFPYLMSWLLLQLWVLVDTWFQFKMFVPLSAHTYWANHPLWNHDMATLLSLSSLHKDTHEVYNIFIGVPNLFFSDDTVLFHSFKNSSSSKEHGQGFDFFAIKTNGLELHPILPKPPKSHGMGMLIPSLCWVSSSFDTIWWPKGFLTHALAKPGRAPGIMMQAWVQYTVKWEEGTERALYQLWVLLMQTVLFHSNRMHQTLNSLGELLFEAGIHFAWKVPHPSRPDFGCAKTHSPSLPATLLQYKHRLANSHFITCLMAASGSYGTSLGILCKVQRSIKTHRAYILSHP